MSLLLGPLSSQQANARYPMMMLRPLSLTLPLVDLRPPPVIEVIPMKRLGTEDAPAAAGTLFLQTISAVIVLTASLATSFVAGATKKLRMLMGFGK